MYQLPVLENRVNRKCQVEREVMHCMATVKNVSLHHPWISGGLGKMGRTDVRYRIPRSPKFAICGCYWPFKMSKDMYNWGGYRKRSNLKDLKGNPVERGLRTTTKYTQPLQWHLSPCSAAYAELKYAAENQETLKVVGRENSVTFRKKFRVNVRAKKDVLLYLPDSD